MQVDLEEDLAFAFSLPFPQRFCLILTDELANRKDPRRLRHVLAQIGLPLKIQRNNSGAPPTSASGN
jgi:hypothetical protein